jgi:hypothetical protein
MRPHIAQERALWGLGNALVTMVVEELRGCEGRQRSSSGSPYRRIGGPIFLVNNRSEGNAPLALNDQCKWMLGPVPTPLPVALTCPVLATQTPPPNPVCSPSLVEERDKWPG